MVGTSADKGTIGGMTESSTLVFFLSPLVIPCSLREQVGFPLQVVDTTLRFLRSSAFRLTVMGTVPAPNTTDMFMVFFLWILCLSG